MSRPRTFLQGEVGAGIVGGGFTAARGQRARFTTPGNGGLVHRVRVNCPTCGPRIETRDWLATCARITRRLGENVGRLCQLLPVKQVADYFGLRSETAKRLDKAHLQRTPGPTDRPGVDAIAMGEFVIQ